MSEQRSKATSVRSASSCSLSAPSLLAQRDALRHVVTELLRWTECIGEDEEIKRETCRCPGCVVYRQGQAALAFVRQEIRANV